MAHETLRRMTANVFVKLSPLSRWPSGLYSYNSYFLSTAQHSYSIYTSQLKNLTPFLRKGHMGYLYLWREEGKSYNFSEADLESKTSPAELTCQYSVKTEEKLSCLLLALLNPCNNKEKNSSHNETKNNTKYNKPDRRGGLNGR